MLNTRHLRFVLPIVFLGALSMRADGYVHRPNLPSEEFTVVKVKQEGEKGKETIRARLKDGTEVVIGERVSEEDGREHRGVIPGSVRVYRLKGTPDLLYFEWTDYIQGNGGYQSRFHLFCTADNPGRALVKGSVSFRGRWGWATGMSGSYRVRYRGNVLRIRTTTKREDTSGKPKPLYRLIAPEHRKRWAAFACSITTTVTRVFVIADGKADLKSTILEYGVQDGDTLDAICDGLRVKREWVQSPQLLEMQVSTIPIVIPRDVALKRYPAVENWEP